MGINHPQTPIVCASATSEITMSRLFVRVIRGTVLQRFLSSVPRSKFFLLTCLIRAARIWFSRGTRPIPEALKLLRIQLLPWFLKSPPVTKSLAISILGIRLAISASKFLWEATHHDITEIMGMSQNEAPFLYKKNHWFLVQKRRRIPHMFFSQSNTRNPKTNCQRKHLLMNIQDS